jgi:hypothetical protein
MVTNQVLLHSESARNAVARTDTASSSARGALDYLEAAGALLEHWKAHPREALAWPVLDTYRVSAEIAVKDAIRLAARCLRSDGAAGADLDPGILEARLSSHATLASLVRHLTALLRRFPVDGSAPAGRAPELLHNLSVLDSAAEGALVVRHERAGGRSLARAGTTVRRDDDLEAVSVLLTDAIVFLAHEVCGAFASFLAVSGGE